MWKISCGNNEIFKNIIIANNIKFNSLRVNVDDIKVVMPSVLEFTLDIKFVPVREHVY